MDIGIVFFFALLAAAPGLIGEGLAHIPGLRRWPWIGYALGGLLAAALNFVAGVSLGLCALGDDQDEFCDEKGSLGGVVAIAGAAAAVVLTVLALVYQRQAVLRWVLWATPAACFIALLVGVKIITE